MGITVAFIYIPLLILLSVKGYNISNNIDKKYNYKVLYTLGAFISMAATFITSIQIESGGTNPIFMVLGVTLPSLIVPFLLGTFFYKLALRQETRRREQLTAIAKGAFGTVWLLPFLVIFWYSYLSILINDISKYF